jgi:hypothetical protein
MAPSRRTILLLFRRTDVVVRVIPSSLPAFKDRDEFGDNRTSPKGKWAANLLKRLKSFQSFENSKIFKCVSIGTEIAVVSPPDCTSGVEGNNPPGGPRFPSHHASTEDPAAK